MDGHILINMIILCCVNTIFILVGSVLNAAVVLCFWNSGHLRKKPCYFTILVLSLIDLACVVFIHPRIILSAIACYLKNDSVKLQLDKLANITSALYILSFSALLTLNIERYVALRYPLYHLKSVTKTKLMLLFSTFLFLVTILKILSVVGLLPRQLPSSMTFLVLLTVMVPTNCRIYMIAKRTVNRNNKQFAHPKFQDEPKKSRKSYKLQNKCKISRQINKKHSANSISPCILAVASFTLCSLPGITFNVLNAFMGKEWVDEDGYKLVHLWISTLLTMNSSFNTMVFFWKNAILRNEGKRVLRAFWKKTVHMC